MRIIPTIFFLILTVTVIGQSTFKHIKTFTTDLNNDNIIDTISLSSSLHENFSFNKISISISDFSKQTFIAKESWTNVDSAFFTTNENCINSDKFFLLKAKDQAVILLFGYLDVAGYREEFSIIHIKDNKVNLVFDHLQNEVDVGIPTKLADLDGDGKIDFVYTGYYELYEQVDSLNADIGTYHPYIVYSIDNDCKVNEVLTKKYNEENYVYAGTNISEEIKVLYPRDGGKPIIVK